MLENENGLNEEVLKKESELENSNKGILENKVQEKITDKNGFIFLKRILSGVIDQIIVIAISIIIFLLANFILKLCGFYIVERDPIFFILYVIINILYGPICNSSKLKKTIGLKINFK